MEIFFFTILLEVSIGRGLGIGVNASVTGNPFFANLLEVSTGRELGALKE